MSASQFTLGELKPRKLGMSKRNALFPSLSSKGLFTIDIDRSAEENKIANRVFDDDDDCIENEDLSSDSSGEIGMRDPTQDNIKC